MKKYLAVSLMALLLCGGALVVNAQGPEGGPHKGWGGPGHGMGMALHELNLTDAQKAQVKEIMQANHANMKPLFTQMMQNRAALLAATANGQYEESKIQALALQAGQLHAAMIANHEKVAHQIYTQVLTPDQQAQAEQLRTQQINRINQYTRQSSPHLRIRTLRTRRRVRQPRHQSDGAVSQSSHPRARQLLAAHVPSLVGTDDDPAEHLCAQYTA